MLSQPPFQLDGSVLPADRLEQLGDLMPSPQEAREVARYHGDKSRLGEAEQWFLAVATVPRLSIKVRRTCLPLCAAPLVRRVVFTLHHHTCRCAGECRACGAAVSGPSHGRAAPVGAVPHSV